MTAEQAKQHNLVIKWFVDNSTKGIWVKEHTKWFITSTPTFELNVPHIQNDEYAELRKAQADGKAIQEYSPCPEGGDGTWSDTDIIDSNYLAPDEYRIKPAEPEFKVGDWVRDKVNCNVIQLGKAWCESGIEHWKPRKDELVVVWDNDDNARTIFKMYDEEHVVQSRYEQTKGAKINIFDHVEPYVGQDIEI